jgi:hypothetical protein
VVSLYGDRLRPTRAQLHDLDAVLFDIPDVGVRFYTYAWTLWHALAACADAGVPLIVLDRPNPLGGDLARAEGPMLDLAHRSFLGEHPIPIVHACTLGELVRLWQAEAFPSARVTVVPVTGWSRTSEWPVLGVPWVPTSPAMPSFACARWYAGLCLFEATNVSVGRGTPLWTDSSATASVPSHSACICSRQSPSRTPRTSTDGRSACALRMHSCTIDQSVAAPCQASAGKSATLHAGHWPLTSTARSRPTGQRVSASGAPHDGQTSPLRRSIQVVTRDIMARPTPQPTAKISQCVIVGQPRDSASVMPSHASASDPMNGTPPSFECQ